MMPVDTIFQGDAWQLAKTLPDQSVNCIVTSPPYWGLRDYGEPGQFGLEATPQAYVAKLVALFAELRRVLRDDGTLWLNLGDSYANTGNPGQDFSASRVGYGGKGRGHLGGQPAKQMPPGLKPKDLVGIPWRVALALQDDGWYLRSDIIWHKPNPMPESVTDRPTKAHEYVFLLSKCERYYYDADAVAEQSVYPGDTRHLRFDSRKVHEPMSLDNGSRERTGNPTGETRNRRSVWTIATAPYAGAHFATFPPALVEPCVKAGCPVGGVVLDPFMGSGTVAAVAASLGRRYVGFELNPDYIELANARLRGVTMPLLAEVL